MRLWVGIEQTAGRMQRQSVYNERCSGTGGSRKSSASKMARLHDGGLPADCDSTFAHARTSSSARDYTVNKLQTFATGGVLAMGLMLGLTFTVGDAASRDASPTIRTIVPTVAIAQPGVTVQGATLPAEMPQPDVRSPDSDATPATVPGVNTNSVAAFAIQPGVTGSTGQPRSPQRHPASAAIASPPWPSSLA